MAGQVVREDHVVPAPQSGPGAAAALTDDRMELGGCCLGNLEEFTSLGKPLALSAIICNKRGIIAKPVWSPSSLRFCLFTFMSFEE